MVDGYLTPEEQSSIFAFFVASGPEKPRVSYEVESDDTDDDAMDSPAEPSTFNSPSKDEATPSKDEATPSKDEATPSKGEATIPKDESPMAGCSKEPDIGPQSAGKMIESGLTKCPFPTVPRKGVIHPTPVSQNGLDGDYIVRRFGLFRGGKSCEFDEYHKVDFTVSASITLTGIGIFGTRCDSGQERVVLVEVIETSTGIVMGSGKLRFKTEGGTKVYHVKLNDPVTIQPEIIYTASSNFDQNYPFHTYHGIHGKRIITITSKIAEPEVPDPEPTEVEGQPAPGHPLGPEGPRQVHERIEAMAAALEGRPSDRHRERHREMVQLVGAEQDLFRLERNVPGSQSLLRIRIQSIKQKLKVLAKDLPEERRGKVYKKVTFTFFKTETCRSLSGKTTKYTGDTCGSVGQIPHLLFRF